MSEYQEPNYEQNRWRAASPAPWVAGGRRREPRSNGALVTVIAWVRSRFCSDGSSASAPRWRPIPAAFCCVALAVGCLIAGWKFASLPPR